MSNIPNQEAKIAISNNLIQALGDYLISRPYREVAGLIAGLQAEVQASASFNNIAPANQGNSEIPTNVPPKEMQ